MQDVNDINYCTCYSGGDKMSANLEASEGFQREGKRGGQRDGRMVIGLEGFTRLGGLGRNKRGGRGLEGGEGGK